MRSEGVQKILVS